jgi:hypothetical protein
MMLSAGMMRFMNWYNRVHDFWAMVSFADNRLSSLVYMVLNMPAFNSTRASRGVFC